MKFDLQYFAKSGADVPPSSAVSPSSGSQATQSSNPSSTANQSKSSSGKTYNQSDVNRMMSEAANDAAQKLTKKQHDAIANAVSEQKKKDNMSMTELKAYNKKVQKQKLNKIMAENKKYKHNAQARKALQATTKALDKAGIPNGAQLAKLAMDLDPDARTQKVQALINWLKSFKSSYKDKLLAGKREPQTGGNAGNIPSSDKDGKKLNPFLKALQWQKEQGR